jgi:hypothetical protein
MIVAACGAGSKPKTTAAASDPQFQLAQCMRAHGAPNYPDPVHGAGGEGFSIRATPDSSVISVNGIPFSGPAFQSAVKTCKLFGGGSGPPAVSESQKQQEFAFARCIRAHGVPNFPDPVFPAGGGIERPDVPGLNRNSPAFQKAIKACNPS